MKRTKKVADFVVSAAIMLSMSMSALANTTMVSKPALLDSATADVMSSAQELGIITDDMDKSAVVTRKNLCKLLVKFYRVSTGGTGVTISSSPFFDCDANEVVFCYENGIMQGVGDSTFVPEYFITREEVCEIVVNAIRACDGNVIYPDKDCTKDYLDKAEISDKYLKDVNYLSSIGVVNGYDGYFYPKSYITYEQAASMLVNTYYQIMLSKISINGTDISIGDSEQKIIQAFGSPSYKFDDNAGGMSVWVYKGDPKNFFYLGMRGGQVSEIFSNGNTFSYREIESGSSTEDIDFGARAQVSGSKAIYEDGYGTVEIGAFSGENKISYVYAASANISLRHNINSGTLSDDVTLIYDVLNAERVKHGLDSFIVSKKATSAAKVHALSMAYWEYLDYVNRDGASPFERLDDKEIGYTMASENIVCGNTIADVYTEWMGNAGSRGNILSEYMDNTGMGIMISSSNKKAYVAMEFIKPKLAEKQSES